MNNTHHPDQPRCKKLTEIGFPKTFLCIDEDGTHRVSEFARRLHYCPSIAEMLDFIPYEINFEGEVYYFDIRKFADFYQLGYAGCMEFSDHLPYALADLIFWLKENHPTSLPF